MRKLVLVGGLAVLLCCADAARAEDNYDPATLKPGQEMNGIRLQDYAGFQDKWKLVTVRYRVDTTELRFTYANPAAYAALTAGGKDYPDGAVFGKIGLMTADDPAFTSSKVPSGAKRIQLMVRDKVKYASTGGWGFAVFDPKKDAEMMALPQQSPERDKQKAATTRACFACHEIVKARTYVFSVPADLMAAENMMTVARPTTPVTLGEAPAIQFSDADIATLPEPLHRFMPPQSRTVRLLQGKLREHVVIGTLGEIRPTLVEEAAKSGLPALFLSNNATQFTLVVPDLKDALPDGKACPVGQKAYRTYSSQSFNNVRENFCN